MVHIVIAVDRIKFNQERIQKSTHYVCDHLSGCEAADKIGKMFEKMLKLGKPVELCLFAVRRANSKQYIVEEFKEKRTRIVLSTQNCM